MLVRVVADDDVMSMHEDIINSTTGGSRMGASEQAKADAKKITLEDLDRYAENETGDLTTAANAGFVSGIIYNVTNDSERNAYLDDNGHVNADGISRVKRALFSLAYGDDNLIAKMAESTDDNTRNITNGLTNAAPLVAKINLSMQATGVKYDLAENISEAVKRFDSLRSNGKSVENYLSEQSLFSETTDTPETREILKALDEFRRSGKKVSAFVRRMAELVQSEIDQQAQGGLMPVTPMSLESIIKTARKNASDGEISESPFDMAAQTSNQEGTTNTSESTVDSTQDSTVNTAQENAENTSAWGDKTEIENDMLAALGLNRAPNKEARKSTSTKAESKKKDSSIFKVNFSDEEQAEWDKAKAAFKAAEKAAANRVNSGIDPTFIAPVFQMGTILLKHGVRTFAKFAKTMISELGDSVRPWLRPVWEMLQTKPQNAKYSEEQLMPVFKFVGKTMEYNGGNMSYSEVEKRFAGLVGKDNVANFRDLLKVAYQGADCFYHRNEEVTDNELYDSTGDKHITGSIRDSYDGPATDDGRNAESIRPTENRPDDGGNAGTKSKTVNKDNFKAGDSEQIAASLSCLLKEQVGDVVKAENRLLVNDGAAGKEKYPHNRADRQGTV